MSVTGSEGQAEANKDGIISVQFKQAMEITVSDFCQNI